MNHEAKRNHTNGVTQASLCSFRVASWFISICLLTTFMPALAQTHTPRGAQAGDKGNAQVDVGTLLVRAVEALQAGRLDEAEPLLRRAAAVAPTNADAHSLLGALLDQRGRTAEAERAYRTALTLNPRHVAARANLGVLLARTDRADEAISTFEEVLKLAPEHPQATYNLGLLYVAKGNYGRAEIMLERARAYQPNNVAVLAQLALTLYELK